MAAVVGRPRCSGASATGSSTAATGSAPGSSRAWPTPSARRCIALTYLVPDLRASPARVVARWRHRAFFVLLLVVGVALARRRPPVGRRPAARPRAVEAFLRSDAGLAMRSLPRAVPLVALALAVLLGAGVASAGAALAPLDRPAALVGIAALAHPGAAAAVDRASSWPRTSRPRGHPATGTRPPRTSTAEGDDTRVLEVPGIDFATYRWGNTVDPITPGLIDRPSAPRELIPYGSPASADLLNALDRRLQERTADPDALAPIARLLRAGDVLVRSDLQYERYNTPRPRNFWDLMHPAPGLGDAGPVRRRTAATSPIPDVQLDDELRAGRPRRARPAPARRVPGRATRCRSSRPSRRRTRCSSPATATAWSTPPAPA